MLDWNHPRCWSDPSKYLLPSQRKGWHTHLPFFEGEHYSKKNHYQTTHPGCLRTWPALDVAAGCIASRTSDAYESIKKYTGSFSSSSVVEYRYQESEPSCWIIDWTSDINWSIAYIHKDSRIPSKMGFFVFVDSSHWKKMGRGTPHRLCLEMHQSGLFSIIELRRL